MAILIDIKLLSLDGNMAHYCFLNGGNAGEFQINIETKDFTVVKKYDSELFEQHLARAVHKVKQHLQEGEIPEKF